MRLAGIDTLERANRFLEITFWPLWNERFVVAAARQGDAHRRLEREHRLQEILSVRVGRSVSSDHTVTWNGQRWGVRREDVCSGLRGARAEIEKRLDGTHWLRFRGRYLPLQACPAARRSASPSGLRPAGLADRQLKPQQRSKPKYTPPPNHPSRRTFLVGRNPDISTLR
jgi:hypothetical protein